MDFLVSRKSYGLYWKDAVVGIAVKCTAPQA
jgi:hypothetical protein